MEPWALPAWQSWTPSLGGEPGGSAPCLADTPAAALQVGALKPEENSEPEGAHSPGSGGDIDPEGVETGLPSLGEQAMHCDPGCLQVEAPPKVRVLRRVRGKGAGELGMRIWGGVG